MEGGGKKKQQLSGGAGSGDGAGAGAAREQRPVRIVDELSGRKDKDAAVDASPDIHHHATRVMERQRSRRSNPARFRPPAPRQYDVSKKQSTNSEVAEDGSRNSSAGSEESVSDSTYLTSSVNYGGRDYHTSSAPAASPREPTIDELFSGDANPDVAYRGDWWRGGLYY